MVQVCAATYVFVCHEESKHGEALTKHNRVGRSDCALLLYLLKMHRPLQTKIKTQEFFYGSIVSMRWDDKVVTPPIWNVVGHLIDGHPYEWHEVFRIKLAANRCAFQLKQHGRGKRLEGFDLELPDNFHWYADFFQGRSQ